MIASNDITLIEGENVITDEYEISDIEQTLHSNCRKKSREKNLIK